MRAKLSLGIIIAASIAVGFISGNTLFVPSAAEAQQIQLPGTTAEPVLVRFTTSVSPIWEGGAVGQALPITVEIRGSSPQDVPLVAWRQELPGKIKQALEWELAKAEAVNPFAAASGLSNQLNGDRKLDQILERLDKMEKRIKQIEKKKPTSEGK
jgi:hypothetical protein